MPKKKKCYWFVCDNCGEQFGEDHKVCPSCKDGHLAKTCSLCGCTIGECKCP